MDNLDEILRNISNVSQDINDRAWQSIPVDNNLNALSSIEEINSKLKPFNNFLKIAHINPVSIPLHRDEISRFINKTDLDFVGISETNIKKKYPKGSIQI